MVYFTAFANTQALLQWICVSMRHKLVHVHAQGRYIFMVRSVVTEEYLMA